MEIIIDLDESGIMIEPSNIRELSEMYLGCMRNVECTDDSINYTLLDLGVFYSYESTSSSMSDSNSLFTYPLLRNS